jgi:hypothetical protein
MDPNTFRLAETVHNERLAEAAQARQWARRSVRFPLRARLRLALSKRLIVWGARLYASLNARLWLALSKRLITWGARLYVPPR